VWDFHNPATDVPGLGVPGHVIAYFEFARNDSSPRLHAQPNRNEPFVAVRAQRASVGHLDRGFTSAATIPSPLGDDTARRNSDGASGQALLLHGAGTTDSH
jgi:hypothetical protein